VDAIELAAVLVTLALLASMISVELGVTVALVELTFGVLARNALHLESQDWLTFVAAFASIVLTFLAGMEVDPVYMRQRLGASVGLGFGSFVGPVGLVMSAHYAEHREEQKRLRVVAFAFLIPFFFIKGGLNVSLAAVGSNLGLLGVLLAAKIVPKIRFVYPLARRADSRHATFATLLMSTGLTFGTIASLYGLNAAIIDKTQFSLLVTVVVLTAVIPTAIAERWFLPAAERDLGVGRRRAYQETEEYV
jgi:Kef-type K+ transport system membrane component KefB